MDLIIEQPKELLIKNFKANQTIENLQILRNAGIEIMKIKNNKWEKVTSWELPFERFVIVWGINSKGIFDPIGIGIY